MIDFATSNGTIQVKSSYYDLTVSEYHSIINNLGDHAFILSILTGLSTEQVNRYDFSQVANFIDFLSEDPTELQPIEFIQIGEKEHSNIDIFECSWSKKITADKLIRVASLEGEHEKDEYLVSDIVELVAIYTTKQKKRFDEEKIKLTRSTLENMPVAVVYPFGVHLRSQLLKIQEVELKMLKYEHTTEQKQAGIDEFKKLGVFTTIDMIMREYGWGQHKTLATEYSFIFNKLLLLNINGKFEKRYSKILRDKNKPIGK